MTTKKLRELIEVTDVTETEDTIVITYWFGPWFLGSAERNVVIDRLHDTHLMKWIDGKCSQWDAINVVVAHHEKIELDGVVNQLDMAKFQDDLRAN